MRLGQYLMLLDCSVSENPDCKNDNEELKEVEVTKVNQIFMEKPVSVNDPPVVAEFLTEEDAIIESSFGFWFVLTLIGITLFLIMNYKKSIKNFK